MLSLNQGKKLVLLARATVERCLEKRKFELQRMEDKSLNERAGIFVTIHTFPDKLLHGCIGFTEPMPLWKAVQHAAASSAFDDPRFPPLTKEDLNSIIFEVSVLTEPELIEVKSPSEYAKKIKIGEDGLIMINRSYRGLLLPQVWKQIPNVEKFLETLCWKASLTKDYLSDKNTKIYKFKVQAFTETKPREDVIEVVSTS